MNFAIRKDGKFVGEVILYNFDFRGAAEIGVRILPEADWQGIGRYAFSLTADYAIYQLELSEIRGKCLKENVASAKMLSSVMQKTGEDEIYYYYRKIVWRWILRLSATLDKIFFKQILRCFEMQNFFGPGV